MNDTDAITALKKSFDEASQSLKTSLVGSATISGDIIAKIVDESGVAFSDLNPLQVSLPIAILATRIDDYSTSNVTYIGTAVVNSITSGSVWSIKKMDQTTGIIITWAASGASTQVWDNRTGLTYV